jgi:hypothetical protein
VLVPITTLRVQHHTLVCGHNLEIVRDIQATFYLTMKLRSALVIALIGAVTAFPTDPLSNVSIADRSVDPPTKRNCADGWIWEDPGAKLCLCNQGKRVSVAWEGWKTTHYTFSWHYWTWTLGNVLCSEGSTHSYLAWRIRYRNASLLLMGDRPKSTME